MRSATASTAFRALAYGAVRAVRVALAIGCLLAIAPFALAQEKAEEAESTSSSSKSYMLSFVVVGALVGAGLATICRPSSRRDRPDPEQHADD